MILNKILLGLALVGAVMAWGETTDGPYVMLSHSGMAQAWYADPVGTNAFLRRIEMIPTDGLVTVGGIGLRPAFSVRLRALDKQASPDEESLDSGAPLFIMADSHGEFEICTELLIRHAVIDASLRWTFGRGRLVVLGDVFDRGPHQLEIIWLLYKLEAEARAAGGRVTLILGNHEIMALTGSVSYLNSRYAQIARDLKVARYSELWGTDTLLGRWLRQKATVVKLGSLLCLHGGTSLSAADQRISITEMNSTVRAWLNDEKSEDSGRISWITGKNGPLWYRGLVKADAKLEDVEAIKKFYSVERIAVGHTIVPTVTALYDGSVIAVQVYPTKDKTTGKMNMEGVYIDEQGTWHKAKIDGTREILRDDAGNPIRNGSTHSTGSGQASSPQVGPTPATGSTGSPQAGSGEKSDQKTLAPPEQKEAA